MNILYIDKANSIEEIRIAEQSIWVEEIPSDKVKVFYLLKKINKKTNAISNKKHKNVYFVPVIRPLSTIYFFIKLLNLILKNKINLIVVRNVVDLGLITLFFSKVFNIKLLYIKAFPSIEFKIRKAKENNSSLKLYLLNTILKFEIYLMKTCTYLISRTDKFTELLNSQYNIKRTILSIPMGVDSRSLKKISFEKVTIIRKKYELQNYFSIIYFGSLNKSRNIDFIINVIEKVAKQNKQIKCLIIGGQENEIEDLNIKINNKKLNDTFLLFKEMKREDLFEFIQASDVSISPIPPIEQYILSSPTKVLESLALGCPVLVNKEIIDQNDVINKSGGGISLTYDETSFSDNILNLMNNKDILLKMADKGNNFVLKHRTYNKLAQKVKDLIKIDY